MFSLTLFIKLLASSMVLLTGLSRYLFISLSECKARISCSSLITSCQRVSRSVVKIGKGVEVLFNILSYLVCGIYNHHSLTTTHKFTLPKSLTDAGCWMLDAGEEAQAGSWTGPGIGQLRPAFFIRMIIFMTIQRFVPKANDQ
jgi:hypothetical protein